MSSTNSSSTTPIALRTLLQDRPWNALLKAGTISSPSVTFDFDPSPEAPPRFKAMVREQAFDCGELAVVTLLQAHHYGVPIVALPLVVSGAHQHANCVYNTLNGRRTPVELAGSRIGVRSYAQTSCVWLRGILQHEYGLDPRDVTWVTFEDAHLTQFVDPDNCERAPAGRSANTMLMDGELDAVINGVNLPQGPGIEPLIPEASQAAVAWAARTGISPINHMLVVSRALCEERPDIVRAVYDLMDAVQKATGVGFPNGFDADWAALDLVAQYAFEQCILPQVYGSDDLFAEAKSVLLS